MSLFMDQCHPSPANRNAACGMATSINSAINTVVIVAASGGWPNDCVEGEEAKVEQRVTNNLNPIDQHFVVWFTD